MTPDQRSIRARALLDAADIAETEAARHARVRGEEAEECSSGARDALAAHAQQLRILAALAMEATAGSATDGARPIDSNNHPGGPLSPAERILLAHMRQRLLDVRAGALSAHKLLGAVPGGQKIAEAVAGVLREVDRALGAIKTRKEGAP